jgi:hypothetical protein
MKAMFSLPFADLPGLAMAKCGIAVLAAIPATVRRKVLRFRIGVVCGDDIVDFG